MKKLTRIRGLDGTALEVGALGRKRRFLVGLGFFAPGRQRWYAAGFSPAAVDRLRDACDKFLWEFDRIEQAVTATRPAEVER